MFNIALAANSSVKDTINTIMPKVIDNIISPIIMLMFAVAVFVFLWGMLTYYMKGEDPGERKKAGMGILWGIVGIAVMISVYGILRFVASTLGQHTTF